MTEAQQADILKRRDTLDRNAKLSNSSRGSTRQGFLTLTLCTGTKRSSSRSHEKACVNEFSHFLKCTLTGAGHSPGGLPATGTNTGEEGFFC
jgi:hypothetical protein